MVVGITVLDINDNDPVLLNLPSNASVSEGAPVHASVARVRARDADSGRNALLTYNITAGNLGGAFYINDTVRKNGSGAFLSWTAQPATWSNVPFLLCVYPSVRGGAGEQAS